MRIVGVLAALAVAVAAATAPAPAPAAIPQPAQRSLLGGLPPASLGGPCLPSKRAYLRARIRGALRLDVDLHGRRLECEGGPRLDGSGIRMGFEGRTASFGRLRVIFGITGVKEARPGRELPANLTVIFEDRKLLFATQGDGNCTVDRLTQELIKAGQAPSEPRRAPGAAPAPAAGRHGRTFRVTAHGFCIGPVNDLSGRRRIVVTSFDFAGRVDFNS